MRPEDLPQGRYGSFSQALFERTSGPSIRPVAAQFEITYRCNLHCAHCYTDPFNKAEDLRRELGFSEIIRILDEMAEAGVLWLLLTGGEAATHPRFREIYAAAKERGFIVSLFSNGTVMTESLVEFLLKDPPFLLEISLHGSDGGTFDRITGVRGSFERCLAGLRRLLEAGLPVKLKTKAMTLNRGSVPAIRRFVEDLGLEFNLYTAIYPRLDGDLSSTALRLAPEEVLALEQSQALASGETSEGCPAGPEAPTDRLYRCGCGTNSFTIDPYGRLRACTFTVDPQFDLRQLPFQEAFERLSQSLRAQRYTGSSPCRSCSAYLRCDKNPAMARFEAGTAEAPVPYFCQVAFGRAGLEASPGDRR